jgi:hypothetical protein
MKVCGKGCGAVKGTRDAGKRWKQVSGIGLISEGTGEPVKVLEEEKQCTWRENWAEVGQGLENREEVRAGRRDS